MDYIEKEFKITHENDKKGFKKVDFLICLKYITHMGDY